MLHSVQHLFLSTESPSLPCVDTNTQTKKRCISPASTGMEKEERGIHVVKPRPWFTRGFPSLSPLDSLLPGPSTASDAVLLLLPSAGAHPTSMRLIHHILPVSSPYQGSGPSGAQAGLPVCLSLQRNQVHTSQQSFTASC